MVTLRFTAIPHLASALTPEGAARRALALRIAMLESVTYLRGEVQKLTPVDVNTLRGGITISVSGGSEIIGRVASGAAARAYAAPVEYGRGAGKKMPPPRALLGWVRRHRIAGLREGARWSTKNPKRRLGNRATQDREDLRTAWIIARSIARKGIPAKRMFGQVRMDTVHRTRVSAIFTRQLRRVARIR